MIAFLINILIYCTPIFGAIFVTVAFISKIVLKKNGFNVTLLWMALSDIKKLNELSKEKTDLRILYYSLIISTIGFLSLFLIAFILIITETLARY